ncbi:mutS protein, partial [Coemansia sp. RSA 2530]
TSSLIPNDFHLAEDNCGHWDEAHGQPRRTVVLVGPNASGKSVLLKQIALIVYMAHIGSHVPAKRVLVGLTDRVLALGKTTESLSRRMSTLSADLSSVAKIAELASAKSLVLLDEFGRGTAPVDGISLLCGALASLSLRSDNRPSVLAATHFQGR